MKRMVPVDGAEVRVQFKPDGPWVSGELRMTYEVGLDGEMSDPQFGIVTIREGNRTRVCPPDMPYKVNVSNILSHIKYLQEQIEEARGRGYPITEEFDDYEDEASDGV